MVWHRNFKNPTTHESKSPSWYDRVKRTEAMNQLYDSDHVNEHNEITLYNKVIPFGLWSSGFSRMHYVMHKIRLYLTFGQVLFCSFTAWPILTLKSPRSFSLRY